MRNFYYSLFLLLFCSLSSNAQYTYYQYGKLGPEEMQMEVCPIDKTASAVAICDMGKLWFNRDVDKFQVIFERFMRFKILDEGGLDNRFITIPLYHEGAIKEKLSNLEANTWNLYDRVWRMTELPRTLFQPVVINDNYSLITVELPDVKVGSIVEFKYTITSPFFMPIHTWKFQNNIPTLLSFLEVRMIPFYEYAFLQLGKKPDIQESFKGTEELSLGKNMNSQYGNIKYNEMIYHFGMYNMPATEENPARIDFQLSRIIDLNGVPLNVNDTWEKSIKNLLVDDHFGDFINKSANKAKNLLEMSYYLPMDENSRIEAIVRYVKNKYSWNGVLGKYSPVTVNEFITTKKGNTASINLFTTGLLRAAGIDAFPIILSTKENGVVNTDYPFLHLYDYVLIGARINGQLKFADATDSLLSDKLIPLRCLDTKGLIIEKNKKEWVTCNTPDSSSTKTTLVIHAPVENELTRVEMSRSSTGYDSYLLKDQFKDNKDNIVNYYRQKGYILEPSNIETKNYNKIDKPYEVTATILIPVIPGATVNIDPFMNEAMNVNPLKEQSRNYPSDFYYPLNKAYSAEIIIPDGYTIVKVPEQFSMSNSLIKINYSVKSEPGKVNIDADYHLLKAIYKPSDYSKIKSYLDQIVKQFNEPVVLQKIVK